MRTKSERAEVYNTRHWQGLRLDILSAAGWLCQCDDYRKHGLTKPADLVHHVKPWQRATGKLRQQLAFDRGNLAGRFARGRVKTTERIHYETQAAHRLVSRRLFAAGPGNRATAESPRGGTGQSKAKGDYSKSIQKCLRMAP